MINNFDEISFIKKNYLSFQNEYYNDFINNIINNHIDKIFIDKNLNKIVSVNNYDILDDFQSKFQFYTNNLPNNDLINHYHLSNIDNILLPNIIDKASDYNIPIFFINFSSNFKYLLDNLSVFVIYSTTLFFVFSLFSNFFKNSSIIRNNNNNPFHLPIFNKNFNKHTKYNLTLDDWAGSPELIEECKEIISYVQKKNIYDLIGAEMPKGILLEGPPGTGKTLLAKAIASETNSTFFSCSGSEFVEMFVGVGASRIRDLFNQARIYNPSIIFIDEIDAIGKKRSMTNFGNDEREQTLNQLLYEMDGFNNNTNLIILAATNRKDSLDQALLRPGRFDRILKVPLPDKNSREKILQHYIQSKNIDKIFNISSIAELTDGFSGAQLKNLINEAAILSVRNNYTSIQEKYIFTAFEKLIIGLVKKNSSLPFSVQQRVAIHESGHTLLSILYNQYFDFQKASIQPTYNGAGGYTIFTEKKHFKNGLYTKDLLKKKLVIMLGGKAAENIFYGNEEVSLGSIQDLKQANLLAQKMIGNFGMGDKLEVFYNEEINDDPFNLPNNLNKYSQNTKNIFDNESLQLVDEAYKMAKSLLKYNYDKLLILSDLLLNNTIVLPTDIDKYISL
jgi:cell division protease FtsH